MSGNFEALVEDAQQIIQWCQTLLDTSRLTETQRQDMTAIRHSAMEFLQYATNEVQMMTDDTPLSKKQEVRHQLRNYLNIVVGFSRLMVRDLPDNLLMDMATVRQIHDTGEHLRTQVDQIQ
ncbi:MAG: hypothetical protein AAF846_20400 [Chloroflexota bacterium]